MPLTAQDCVKAIKEAVKEFGTYTWNDKGPDEAMDVDSFEKDLRAMSPEDGKAFLAEVMEYRHGKTKQPYGRDVVSCLLVRVQDLPDAHFETLAEVCPDW